MVTRTAMFTLALSCMAACTQYGDAVLPAVDAGRNADAIEEGIPVRAGIQVAVQFQQHMLQGDDSVKDLLVLDSGVVIVLLEQDCTLVALNAMGALETNFGSGGLYRSPTCLGRKLAYDQDQQRLLFAGMGGGVGRVEALTLDGKRDPNFAGDNYVKVDVLDISVLQPSPLGLLVAGVAAAFDPDNQEDFALTVLDKNGMLKGSVKLNAGYADRPLVFIDDGAALRMVGASVITQKQSRTSLVFADLDVGGNLGTSQVTDFFDVSNYSLLTTPTRTAVSPAGVIFSLGMSLRTSGATMFGRAAVFATTQNGAPLKNFGEGGVAPLPNRQGLSWTELVYTPAGLVMLGWQENNQASNAVLTVLDNDSAKILPSMADIGLVAIETAQAFVPAVAAVGGHGDLVIAGATGRGGGALSVVWIPLKSLPQR